MDGEGSPRTERPQSSSYGKDYRQPSRVGQANPSKHARNPGMAGAVSISMQLRIPLPVCPHCASSKLTFAEPGSGVSGFRCQTCARTTVHRLIPAAAVILKDPDANAFRFPSWLSDRA
jgi:hypothetical protein